MAASQEQELGWDRDEGLGLRPLRPRHRDLRGFGPARRPALGQRQAVAGRRRRRGRRCHSTRGRVRRTGTGTKAVPSPTWSG